MNRSRVLADLRPPPGWDAVPAGAVLTPVARTGHPDEPLLSVSKYKGVHRRQDGDSHSRPSEDLGHYLLALPGDLVVNIMLAWDRGLGVSKEKGLVSPAYSTFTLNEGRVDARFLDYQVRSEPAIAEWRRRSYGIQPSRWRLYWERMSSAKLLLPPLEVQRRVADMLDVETARIDTLITKNQRAAELLRDRLQRVLLDTIGDWSGVVTASLGQLGTDVLTGPFGTALSADEYISGGVPVINPTHIRDGVMTPEPHISVSSHVADRLSRYHLRRGDLILGRKGDLGRSALVGEDEAGWICGSDSMVVRPDLTRMDAEWLMWATRIDYYRQQLEARSRGATMSGLNEAVLLAFRVPKYGVEEQRSRVAAARRHWNEYRGLALRMSRVTSLLSLRRQALITAAVTGQIDV